MDTTPGYQGKTHGAGRIIPPQGGSGTAKPCSMVNLGPTFDRHLSHDSARRISSIGLRQYLGSGLWVIEIRYLLPIGSESIIESNPLRDCNDAKTQLASTVELLKREAGFC